MVRKNWDKFNVKLGREISQAQSRLDSYRGQISESDYERLRGRLGKQKRNDLNEHLNVSASKPGVAENDRNQVLLEKPEFLTESEDQQIARFEKELEVSKKDLSMLREKPDAQELAGWDFVGETANGTDDIWSILEGQDYPRLSWENLRLTIDYCYYPVEVRVDL